MSNDSISFTKQKFLKFKRVYQKAIDSGDDIFTFEGKEFVVGYAKYLIQYLEVKFK